ncbi:MAG: VOC family protein [Hyphomonadaceae bacterium]|nr:VOC family protein [Hyphomonadaceae bacterium]
MVLSLQHLALGIPDLKVGADFYTTFGMNMREGRSDMLAFRCDNRSHDEVVLLETGQRRKFHHISFATDMAGFARIEAALKARGLETVPPPYPEAESGLWFHDPDGNLVNVHVRDKDKGAAEPLPEINRPGLQSRLNARGCPTPDTLKARPRRLGHMILFTPDVPRHVAFYRDVVGMQLSDRIVGDYAAFMRTQGSSDHHVLAFLNSPAPGFHHASFEMGSIDETEVAARRLFAKEYRHAWGPGRHGVGSNYFHYFRDPWNGMAEYFFDIDYITADATWQDEEWTKKDGMFLWSADGPPPPDFGQNYEID